MFDKYLKWIATVMNLKASKDWDAHTTEEIVLCRTNRGVYINMLERLVTETN